MANQQFPDLIKAGLKVGDTVHSYLYGEGKVIEIIHDSCSPIKIAFKHGAESFTSDGKEHRIHLIPSITIHPWNPIAGEPFPFPKWEPKEGEWCAFWDDGDNSFIIAMFDYISEGNYLFKDNGAEWDNCAPIEEAMQIFGITQSE